MAKVAINPPKTPVTEGSLWDRRRHPPQRLQDARPAGPLRAHAPAQHRQER